MSTRHVVYVVSIDVARCRAASQKRTPFFRLLAALSRWGVLSEYECLSRGCADLAALGSSFVTLDDARCGSSSRERDELLHREDPTVLESSTAATNGRSQTNVGHGEKRAAAVEVAPSPRHPVVAERRTSTGYCAISGSAPPRTFYRTVSPSLAGARARPRTCNAPAAPLNPSAKTRSSAARQTRAHLKPDCVARAGKLPQGACHPTRSGRARLDWTSTD